MRKNSGQSSGRKYSGSMLKPDGTYSSPQYQKVGDNRNRTSSFNEQKPGSGADASGGYQKKKKTPFVKTLLEDAYTFWYVYKSPTKGKRGDYSNALKKIFTTDCIEDFWNVYNNMPVLENLTPNADYMMFLARVMPEWEDPLNKEGGKWVLTIPKEKCMDVDLQAIWEKILMSMVGCTIPHWDQVNGAVMSLRDRYYRFSIWVKNTHEKEWNREIALHIRNIIEIPEDLQLVFQIHSNAIARQLDNEYIMAV